MALYSCCHIAMEVHNEGGVTKEKLMQSQFLLTEQWQLNTV